MDRFTFVEWAWMAAISGCGAVLFALHIRATRPLEIVSIILTGIAFALFLGPAIHDAVLPAFAKGESSLTAVGFVSGYLGMLIARQLQKLVSLLAPKVMARLGLDIKKNGGAS